MITGWGRFAAILAAILISTPALGQYGYGGGYGGTAYPADASRTSYTPASGGDWTDPDPSLVQTALDGLAAIVAGAVSVSDVADGEVYQRDGDGITGVTLGALATGASASDVPYTPTDGADWSGPDPTDASGGLNDLAARLTDHEAITVDITDVADGDVYTRSGAGVAGTTLGDLATGTIDDLTADGSPSAGNDYVATWDASAGSHKKVLLNDLPGGGGGGGGGGGVSGAARITASANTSGIAVGTAVNFDTVTQTPGFGVTVSSRTITLPAGAWYTVTCNVGARTTSSAGYIDLKIFDVTGAATAISHRAQWYRPSATFGSGLPPTVHTLVDASAAAVDIELRVAALSSGDYIDDETDCVVIRVH